MKPTKKWSPKDTIENIWKLSWNPKNPKQERHEPKGKNHETWGLDNLEPVIPRDLANVGLQSVSEHSHMCLVWFRICRWLLFEYVWVRCSFLAEDVGDALQKKNSVCPNMSNCIIVNPCKSCWVQVITSFFWGNTDTAFVSGLVDFRAFHLLSQDSSVCWHSGWRSEGQTHLQASSVAWRYSCLFWVKDKMLHDDDHAITCQISSHFVWQGKHWHWMTSFG